MRQPTRNKYLCLFFLLWFGCASGLVLKLYGLVWIYLFWDQYRAVLPSLSPSLKIPFIFPGASSWFHWCVTNLLSSAGTQQSTEFFDAFNGSFVGFANRWNSKPLDPVNGFIRPSLSFEKMLTSPALSISSILMVVPVSFWISWITLPPGPITAPMNSLSMINFTIRGACGFTSGLVAGMQLYMASRICIRPFLPVPMPYAWYPYSDHPL